MAVNGGKRETVSIFSSGREVEEDKTRIAWKLQKLVAVFLAEVDEMYSKFRGRGW